MNTGLLIALVLFAMQGAALAAFLVNATITRRRIHSLKARIQPLQETVRQQAMLIAVLQAQVGEVLSVTRALRQPSPRKASTAHMRAIQAERAELEARWTQPQIPTIPTQRIPYTRPLQPPEEGQES